TSSTSTRSSLASAHNRVLFSTILALAMAQSSVAQAVQVARREHDDAWDSPFKRAVTASTTAPVASRTSHNNANNASGKVNVTRIVVIAIAVTVLGEFLLARSLSSPASNVYLAGKPRNDLISITRMRRTKKDQAAIAAITDPNIRRFSSRPLSSSQRGEGD
ncbi:5685_t:CDS:2, partial [Acaulospora colombiana]